jgi:hypothetical protein
VLDLWGVMRQTRFMVWGAIEKPAGVPGLIKISMSLVRPAEVMSMYRVGCGVECLV